MSALRRAASLFWPVPVLLAIALQQDQAGRPYRAGALCALAVAAAVVAVLVGWPRTRRLLPGVAPVLVAAVFGIVFSPGTAVGPAAVGLVLLGLLAAGVDVAGLIDRVVAWLGRLLTNAVGGVAFIVIVVPAWLWTRLRRRDVLRPRSSGPSTWVDRPAAPARAHALGAVQPDGTARRGLVGRVSWAVGCVVLLGAANYGIGWGWDQAAAREVIPETLRNDTAVGGPARRDPRQDLPAMAAYPWRARYFQDIQRTPGGYWPFTEYRPRDFRSPYVNQDGWLRRSYEPDGTVDAMPTVWMFGGSTTWGEGQRDGYTIASWLSRLAERDGTPIRMDNYGSRGWTHFQEMILYEQQLASEPKPDFSIFYDGANEATSQSLLTEAVPTHTLAYTYAQRLTGATIATEALQQPVAPNVLDDLYHAYSEHSALHKAVAFFRPEPVGASPAQDAGDESPGDGFDGGQETDDDGGVYNYDITDQDGTDAGDVYERGKQFTMLLSERHDVRSFLFWQPMGYNGGALAKARERLTPPTIDIHDALEGHGDVFIDGGHTNEEGARIVAERIWQDVGPAVRAWYEENG